MRLITALLLVLIVNNLQAQKRDLDYYITKAKAFSPLINQAQNENQIAGLDLELINSVLSKPEINIEASALFAPIISHDNSIYKFEFVSNGASNYTGYDMALTDGGQYQSVVSIKQPLFTSTSLKTYSNKADITRQMNENRISLTSHELEKIISHQYILCLKSKKSANISLELLKEFNDRILVMQKLVESAIFKVSDLMLMQIELDNYKLDYETYLSDFRTNLYDLNVLCGINDTIMVELQELDLQLSSSNNSSSFLTSYRLDSLNITADQSISDLKYKPQVNLFANAGLNAIYLPAFNRFGLSTGITFSWNIFDGYQQKIQKQKTGINLLTVEFEKHNFVVQQDIYKKSVLNRLSFLDKNIQLINSQIVKYDELLKAYRSQLSQGDISVMDFKNLEKDFVAKKQERALLGLEKQALIISYNYWNY